MSSRKYASLAVVLTLSLSTTAAPQTPGTKPGGETADFRVQVWGETVAEFSTRVQRYLELRHSLEEGLPPLAMTDDPDDILRAEVALARAIRRARRPPKEGDIFTSAISGAFRRALLPEIDEKTADVIMDENPGAFLHNIAGSYPKEKPRSTVPWNVLAALPPLPDDIHYRFVGRYLILHDIRANVIVDRMTCAIQCESRTEAK